jgi:hypothetical protein
LGAPLRTTFSVFSLLNAMAGHRPIVTIKL